MLVRFSADQLPTSVLDTTGIEWDAISANPGRCRRATPTGIVDLPGLDGPHDLRCSGTGATAHGGLISLERLGPDLCEAEIVATLPDDRGGVFAFGRSRRLASKAQRLPSPRATAAAVDRPGPDTPRRHRPPPRPRLRCLPRLRPLAINRNGSVSRRVRRRALSKSTGRAALPPGRPASSRTRRTRSHREHRGRAAT